MAHTNKPVQFVDACDWLELMLPCECLPVLFLHPEFLSLFLFFLLSFLPSFLSSSFILFLSYYFVHLLSSFQSPLFHPLAGCFFHESLPPLCIPSFPLRLLHSSLPLLFLMHLLDPSFPSPSIHYAPLHVKSASSSFCPPPSLPPSLIPLPSLSPCAASLEWARDYRL